MRTLLATLLAFTATLSFAEVAVYDGFQLITTTPSTPPRTAGDRVIEVVDLTNSQIVIVSLKVTPTTKTYSVSAPIGVVIADIAHSRGAGSTTVLANASTNTDSTTGVTTVTEFTEEGDNAQVIISGTTATSVPRLLKGHSITLTTAGTATPPATPSITRTEYSLVLRPVQSLTANNAGDTLAAAVTAVTTELATKGFTAAP